MSGVLNMSRAPTMDFREAIPGRLVRLLDIDVADEHVLDVRRFLEHSRQAGRLRHRASVDVVTSLDEGLPWVTPMGFVGPSSVGQATAAIRSAPLTMK